LIPSQTNGVTVGQLAAEWRERLRKGERPELDDYLRRYPGLADEIRELFPAVVMIEELKGEAADLTASTLGTASPLPEGKPLERLGDFRILREIGRGGMGIVYEAEQESLGRRVALKVLPAQALLDPHKRQRFLREVKAAARMHHTNIVPVYGVAEHDGLLYYVMQYIQGLGLDVVVDEVRRLRTGRQVDNASGPSQPKDVSAADVAQALVSGQFAQPAAIADDSPSSGESSPYDVTRTQILRVGEEESVPRSSLDPESKPAPAEGNGAATQPSSTSAVASSVVLAGTTDTTSLTESGRRYWLSVARIGIQVADALDYAHNQGILHRDIKPSNLLLDTQGIVWVTDFGLAKPTTEGGENLTHTGDIVGTLRYMAPERYSGQSDARGDIYGLGLTLYELITLQAAFGETDRSRLIKQVTSTEPPRPRKLCPAVPRDLETIILKVIDREPARRYQTAGALAEDLKCFVEDKPIRARRVSAAERLWRWCRRNPAVASLAAAVFLLLLVVAAGSTIAAFHLGNLAEQEKLLRDREKVLRTAAENAQVEAEQSLDEANRQKERAEDNFREAARQRERADAAFRQALIAADESLTQISESRLLSVPGLQPLRKELLNSALKYYLDFQKQHADDPALQKDLAGAYARIGKITAEIGSKEEALKSYQQAFAIRSKLLQKDLNNLDLQTDLAFVHQAVGRLQQQIGDLDGALKSFKAAQQLLQAAVPKGRDQPDLLNSFSSVLYDTGSVYEQRNEPLEALSYYEPALKLQRQLVQENTKHPRIASLKYELADQLNRRGRLHSEMNLADALDLHGEALAILKDLVNTNRRHGMFSDFQRALAASHAYVGDVHNRNNRATAALESYQAALALYVQLATANPAVTDYQSDVASTYFTLALLQAKTGQKEAAAVALQQAIERQRVVVGVAPGVVEYSRSLSRQTARLGSLQRQLNQPAASLRSFKEARSVLEKLPRPDAGDLYELAVARAVCSLLAAQGKTELSAADRTEQQKDNDLALEALRRAVAAGFRDLERFKADTELADLHSRPEYKTLLAELEKRARALQWEPDLEAAKAQAVREKKDLFIYFTGSDWCPPCVMLRTQVLDKDVFIDYVTRRFVMVELDFPRFRASPKNFAKNQDLMRHWGLNVYPSLILADSRGRPYASVIGSESTPEAYVKVIDNAFQKRAQRDGFLAKAAGAEGVEKAKLLDQAFNTIPPNLVAAAEFADLRKQIIDGDSQDKAGLRSTYLATALNERQAQINALVYRQDWNGTILQLDKIIEELKPTDRLTVDMLTQRARAQVCLGDWEKAEADYAKALNLRPDDANLRFALYESYGTERLWAEAVPHMRKAVELASEDYWKWYNLAPLLLQVRDVEGFRQVCRDLLARFGNTQDLTIAERISKACLLLPAKGADLERATKLANKAASNPTHGTFRYAQLAKGLAEYRNGRSEAAIGVLNQSLSSNPPWSLEIPGRFVLAMAQQQLGRANEAKQALAKGEEVFARSYGVDNAIGPGNIHDWLICRVLRRQAYEQVTGKPPVDDQRERLRRGRVYTQRGEKEKADAEFQAAVAVQADDPKTWLARSRTFTELKLNDRADADLAKAQGLLKSSDDASAWRELGAVQKLRQRPQEVVAAYRRAVVIQRRAFEEAPGEEPVRQLLNNLYEELVPELRAAGEAKAADAAGKELEDLLERHAINPLRTFREQPNTPFTGGGLALLPDGRHAISAGTQGTVRVWEIDSGREVRRFPAGGIVPRIAVTSDGHSFLAAGSHETFALRDIETGKEVRKLVGHAQNITAVALVPGDELAVTASMDNTVQLWDLATGKQVRRFTGHTNIVFNVLATPDGRRVVTASPPDNTVRLWELETGKEIHRINVAGYTLSASPDSRRLLIGSPNGLILWDLESGKEIRRLERADWGMIFAVQFLLDGRRALAGTGNSWLVLIDVDSGRELSRMKGPAGQYQLALLPSGDRALTADTDGAVRLWSVPLAAAPDQAAVRFQRLLTEVADKPLLRGQVLDQAVRWEPVFEKLRALRPEDVQLWVARGSYDARIGEREQAVADYLKASELQPANSQWKTRASKLPSDLIAAWNFDVGAAGWSAASQCRITPAGGLLKVESTGNDPQMTVAVSAPAGWKKLTIRARTKEPIKGQVFWATSSRPSYAEQFSEWFDMRPTGDQWTESTVYFNAEANLTSIRFDPGGVGSRLEIDSISLVPVRDKGDFELIVARLSESIKSKADDAERWRARGQA
jgi:tetratricopeptide (TPR) repeat protein